MIDGQSHADGRGHRLADQMDFSGSHALAGVSHGPLFYFCATRRDRDHDLGPHEKFVLFYFADKTANHLFGNFKIGDDAVLERASYLNAGVFTPHHLFGFFADGNDFLGGDLAGDNRGLVEDDSLAFDKYQGIGGAQIYAYFMRKETR